MKISKHELESMIKEELAKEEITEASLNPFKRAHDRGQQTGLGWRGKLAKFLDLDSTSDTELTAPGEPGPTKSTDDGYYVGPADDPDYIRSAPEAAPTPDLEDYIRSAPEAAPTPAAPTAATSKKTGEDVMPISGTEFQTMQYIAKQNGTDILKAIREVAANIGAAARDPQSQQLVKSFNKAFFPALVKMTKNPNIDIAEGIDMEVFLEQNEPPTALEKARARSGAQAYFKSVKGKPPLIVRQITKSLEDALLKKVDATPDGILYDAAAAAGAQIKDPKDKKEYEGAYIKMLAANPKKRLEIYKQNVAAFIQAVAQIAMAAAATVQSPAAPRRSLPEEIRESENKELGRMKVLSGIK